MTATPPEGVFTGTLGGYGDRLTLPHVHGRRYEFIYLAADLFTGKLLAELPMRDVSFSWKINAPGEFSGSVQVPALANIGDYFTATMPGKAVIYVIRDGLPMWGGIIWKRTFGSDSRELKIEADTWDSYMYHRILDEEVMAIRDPIEYEGHVPEREGIEQIEMFRYMWTKMSAVPNGNIGVVLGNQISEVKRGIYFSKWDFKTYGEHLEAFAKKVNGFEWCATVALSADKTSLERRVGFAWPKFGRTWDQSHLVWEYPAWTLKYTWAADADKSATAAYVTGGGDGDLKAYHMRLNDDALALGWPRIDHPWDHSTVWDQGILKSHAGKYLEAFSPPISEVNLTIHPRVPAEVGQYFLGDEVRLIIDDELFYHAGVEERDMLARIEGLTVKPNDDGLEEITPETVIVARDLVIVDPEDETNDLVPPGWNGPTIDAPDQMSTGMATAASNRRPTSTDQWSARTWKRGLRPLPDDPIYRWGGSRE